jgi:hypothetical protein
MRSCGKYINFLFGIFCGGFFMSDAHYVVYNRKVFSESGNGQLPSVWTAALA